MAQQSFEEIRAWADDEFLRIRAEIDAINDQNRERVLDEARTEARENAIGAGATADSVEILEIEQVPISYLPGNPTRLRVKAVGDLPI